MNTRSPIRAVVFLAAACLLLVPCPAPPRAETPPSKPLTAEQRAKLKERDRLEAEVKKLYAAGKLAEAIAAVEKGLAIEREVFGPVHQDVADSLGWLTGLHEQREDFESARKARKEVVDIATRLYGRENWRATDARLALANLELKAKLTPEQRQRLRAAVADNQRVLALFGQGKYREAVPLAERLAEQRKLLLGEKHPDYATSLNNLALLYKEMGDYVKAEPLYNQARDIFKQALGEGHPDYASSLNNLAALYNLMGDYAKAEPLYLQARDIYKEALGEQHPSYAISLNNLAALYWAMGDFAKAEPLYRQARDIRKEALGERHPDYAASLNNLALLYMATDDYDRAEPLYRRARDIFKQALGEGHPDYATTLNNLAVLYYAMGDYAKAESLCHKALAISRDNLELAAAIQSQRQQLDMLQDLRSSLDAYLSLGTQAKQPASRLYEPVLTWKGAVGLRQRNQRLARRHPELAADFAQLDRVAARLATLALGVPDPDRLDARRQENSEVDRGQGTAGSPAGPPQCRLPPGEGAAAADPGATASRAAPRHRPPRLPRIHPLHPLRREERAMAERAPAGRLRGPPRSPVVCGSRPGEGCSGSDRALVAGPATALPRRGRRPTRRGSTQARLGQAEGAPDRGEGRAGLARRRAVPRALRRPAREQGRLLPAGRGGPGRRARATALARTAGAPTRRRRDRAVAAAGRRCQL
jgi:tetratricopeptide (TPR) repeat protein